MIKSALIRNIAEWMEGVAVILPLNRGGYVVISQESLEGIAPMRISEIIPGWRSLSVQDLRTQVDPAADEEED